MMRRIAIGVAVLLVFSGSFAAIMSRTTDLRRPSSRYFGIVYYPHGPAPAAGEAFVCSIWFPPLSVSSSVIREAAAIVTVPVSTYGVLIESARPRNGCPLNTWDAPFVGALLVTAGAVGVAFVLRAALRRRSRA